MQRLNFRDTIITKPVILVPDMNTDGTIKSNKTGLTTYYDSLRNMIRVFFNKKNEFKNIEIQSQQLVKQIDSYDVEIYKKFSIPFACVVFALLGAPLGYRVKKGGFGIAAGLSLLFFLLYWVCLIGGEKLADRALVSPFTGMWIANIIIGLLGLYLMFKSS